MKVTSTTKELVKQIILDGEIKPFTAEETLAAFHQCDIKLVTYLAKERNDYIALYKQGIDTL
jgi:hypothetical protein